MGWPLWVDAPTVEPDRHVRVRPLDAGDRTALVGACQDIAGRPLDPTRPLWELWLLPGLPDQRVGAYLRLHHVADGAAAAAAFGALLDTEADAPDPIVRPRHPRPRPTPPELVRDNVRRRGRELARGCAGLLHPARTLRSARAALPAWREVLTDEPAPSTSINAPVGPDRLTSLVPGDLERVRQIAHAHHATVNDVVLAAVACAWGDSSASAARRCRA